MTQPPGYPPQHPAPPYVYHQPPPRRRNVLSAILLAAVAALSLLVGAAVLAGLAQADKPPAAPAAPVYVTPTAADFSATAQVVRRRCFNTAGCNVTFKPVVEYTGGALDPAATWTVVYEARPVIGGAFTGQFSVTGSKVTYTEQVVRVPNQDTKLMLRVTEVLPG